MADDDRDLMDAVRCVIARVVEESPDDTERAVKLANRRVRRMRHYDQFVDGLVFRAIQDMVGECVSARNRRIKKSTGHYEVKNRRKVDQSNRSVREAYEELFSYHMGGRELRYIRGEEFCAIAEQEARTAEGYHFRERLALRLAKLVPEGKTVREALTGQQLQAEFERAKGRKTA